MADFMCIACRGKAPLQGENHVCASCGRVYPIRQGIPDFMPDPALMQELGLDSDNLDESVESYDAIHSADLFNASAEMAETMTLAKPQAGQRILDVGCGTGLLYDYLPQDAQLTGLDISTAALATVNRRHGHVQLVRGIGESLPFPEKSFDLVFCMGSLEHFLSMELGISEFHRVLKPGGSVIVLLPRRGFLIKNAIYYYIYPNFHPLSLVKRALLRIARFKGLHVQHRDHHFGQREAEQLFSESSLDVVEWRDIPSHMPQWLRFDYLIKLQSRVP